MKKIISLAVMTLVVFALSTTTVYAEETADMGQGVQQGQRGGPPMDENGTPPELPEGFDESMTPPERSEMDENGTPPEKPEGEEGMGGGRGGPGGDMLNLEDMQTALESIEDTDARDVAQTLLAAYQTAMETERTAMDLDSQSDETMRQTVREAVEAARLALEEALTALGLDISDFALAFDGEMPDFMAMETDSST